MEVKVLASEEWVPGTTAGHRKGPHAKKISELLIIEMPV